METNAKMERVKFTITSPGWTEDLIPDINRELGLAQEVLQRPLVERGDKAPTDDFLRGYIRGLRFAFARPAQLLTEYESAIEQAKKDAEPDPPAAGSPYKPEPEA